MALGENIRRMRRDKQWTQGKLAEVSGIKISHISKLERNSSDPKLGTLCRLLSALECSPNALLNDLDKTPLHGRVEIAMEGVQMLSDENKTHILDVVDKYCIAIRMQGLMDNTSKPLLGINQSLGKTEELASK
jgi:transcriptional regulator with XRE-family HTH domain